MKGVRSKYFEEKTYLDDVEDPTDKVEIEKLMLTSNLKKTAKFLEEMYDTRMRLM